MENLIEKKGIVYLLRQSNFSRLLVGIAFFLSIVGTIASLMLPLIIRNVIDSFSYENIGMKDFFILGMILIVQLVFSYISSIILAFQGEKIVSDTRITIWHKLLRLKVNYFNSLSSGELTSYLINDSVSIKNMITVQIPLFLNSCITLIGSVIILIAMDVQMTVLILLVVPTIALVTIPIGKRMSKLSRKNQDQLANLTGFSNQILGEIKLVKSANAEKFEEDRGDEKIKSLFKTGFAVSKLQALITPVILLLLMVSFTGVLAFGQYRVVHETLTSGTLMAFLLYMFQLINPLSNISSFFNAMQSTRGAVQRILEILRCEIEPYETSENLATLEIEKLSFFDVTFCYQEDKKPTLDSISFQAAKGKKIAIVGPSGAGKTTILSLIERFYVPNSGKIATQSGDISEIPLQNWRDNLAYVSQDTPVLSGTLYENLTYGINRKVTIQECKEALIQTNLLNRLTENTGNLQLEIEERGKNLSGGEKQRVAIARTFLKDAPILIFDEATANLDADSEKIIQSAIKKLSKDKITIIIAHRLSTIMDSDEILFLEHGKITGKGNHYDLLKNHDTYKRYVDNQFLSKSNISVSNVG